MDWRRLGTRFLRNTMGLILCPMKNEKCAWRKRTGECSKSQIVIRNNGRCDSILRPPRKYKKDKLILVSVVGFNCYVPINRVQDSHGYFNYLHRKIYEAAFGCDVKDSVIRHSCNNPMCVNPDHLRNGTHADNVMDRVLCGHSAKGEKNGRVKLRIEEVRLIRKDRRHSSAELGRQFNVDRTTIRDVRRKKTWRHIPEKVDTFTSP